jgi:hypothetical protein
LALDTGLEDFGLCLAEDTLFTVSIDFVSLTVAEFNLSDCCSSSKESIVSDIFLDDFILEDIVGSVFRSV